MFNRLRCTLLLLLSFFVSAEAFCRNDATAAEFRDPTAEERAMTSVPFAPGASAVVLNWYQFVNDRDSYRTEYLRIKILSSRERNTATSRSRTSPFSATSITSRRVR